MVAAGMATVSQFNLGMDLKLLILILFLILLIFGILSIYQGILILRKV